MAEHTKPKQQTVGDRGSTTLFCGGVAESNVKTSAPPLPAATDAVGFNVNAATCGVTTTRTPRNHTHTPARGNRVNGGWAVAQRQQGAHRYTLLNAPIDTPCSAHKLMVNDAAGAGAGEPSKLNF